MNEVLNAHARNSPGSLAVIYGDASLSYAGLTARRDSLAAELAQLGIEGDRVGISLPNSDFFLLCFFALQINRSTPVPMNPQLKLDDVLYCCRELNLRHLVITRQQYESWWGDHGISREVLPASLKGLLLHAPFSGTLEYVTLSENAPPMSRNSDESLILLSSGSTGKPKGALFNEHSYKSGVARTAAALGIDRSDKRLIVTPLSHGPGLHSALVTLSQGGSVTLLTKPGIPDLILHEVESSGITSFYCHALLYSLLCQRGAGSIYPMRSLRLCLCGASLLPQDVKAAWKQAVPHAPLTPSYGMTEIWGNVAVAKTDRTRDKPSCIGRPLPGVEFRLLESGELLLRSDAMMTGYAGEDAPFIDGWFSTGDLIRPDEEGDWIYQGRLKELIKHQGFSVIPYEVETVLLQFPGIKLAKVFGRTTESGNEEIIAAIQVPGPLPEINDIRSHCAARLAAYKLPGRIVFISDQEISAQTGKIDKKRIL